MADNDLETLVRELGASTQPITAVGVSGKVTLRQAIGNVYWKATSVLKLSDRPRDPRQGDDQFGHILSLRAEVQILRGIVTELAKAQGVDVKAVTDRVLEALK